MDPVSFGLDPMSVEICRTFLPEETEPVKIRELFKDLYELQNKHITKIHQFKLEKDIGDRLIDVRFFYPDNYKQNPIGHKYNVIFYLHGGGFMVEGILKLPKEISNRTNSVVIYPCYGLTPEEKYPLGIKQCHQLFKELMTGKFNPFNDINVESVSIIGESSGGNYALALPLMLIENNETSLLSKIDKVLAYYPITNDDFDTPSYLRFGEKFYLTRESMKWCWKNYTNTQAERDKPTCAPLKATPAMLKHFPDTMIITAETDVLSSEGEQFAIKLSGANGGKSTSIRMLKAIHGFVSLDQTDQLNSCRLAMDISMNFLNHISNNSIINENNNKTLLKLI